MKAVLTLEFDKLADLREAVQRLAPNGPTMNIQLLKPAAPVSPEVVPFVPVPQPMAENADLTTASNAADPGAGLVPKAPAKPPRKPRADAGKPRGPYKTTTTGEPVTPEAVRAADSDAETAAAPATPTKSAAPTSTPAGAAAATEPSVAADPSKPLTLDDARAALALISGTKGMGMAACMQHLGAFGVIRISDLKPEHYPLFIRQAREKVAEAAKEAQQ